MMSNKEACTHTNLFNVCMQIQIHDKRQLIKDGTISKKDETINFLPSPVDDSQYLLLIFIMWELEIFSKESNFNYSELNFY